jgi:hypothetical protein
MISFTKNYSLENIKSKLIILYVLNVSDIIFTHLLIDSSLFVEANVLMVKAVQDPSLSFVFNVLLPAILFIFIIECKKQPLINLNQQTY